MSRRDEEREMEAVFLAEEEQRHMEREQERWMWERMRQEMEAQQLAEWEGDIEYASWFPPPPGSAA